MLNNPLSDGISFIDAIVLILFAFKLAGIIAVSWWIFSPIVILPLIGFLSGLYLLLTGKMTWSELFR